MRRRFLGSSIFLAITLSLAGCGNASKATSLSQRTQPKPDGKFLFQQNCAVCHTTSRPKDPAKLVAPPIMGVMWHVKQRYPTKEEAIRFIVDYVQNPSHTKALCPSVRRFGLMPPIRHLSQEELEAIASYIFDTYPPRGFRHPPMGRGM
ncbi:MAG: cytochrome c [Epsilonproteobacteria bacterium]|nr:cytochrome c [Campylobacterota bacterium]